MNRCILGEVFRQEDRSRRNNQHRLSVTRTGSRDQANVIHESLEEKLVKSIRSMNKDEQLAACG